MKILMVNKFLHPNGGSETYIFKLGEQLQKLGHDVQYFGMEHERRIVGNQVECYTANMDFHTGKLQKLLYPFKIIYSLEAKKKIETVLTEFQPDVVHVNNFNFQLTPSILYGINKYRKETKKNIKIVYTAHDSQLVCPNHLMQNPITGERCQQCLRKNSGACIKNKCIHGSTVKSLLAAFENMLYKKLGTYKLLDVIICPSYFIKEKLDTDEILRERTLVLHNFVNEEFLEKVEKEDYILFFGRFSIEKGIETLTKVCKELPQIPFRFAGTGPMEDLVDQCPNVKKLGFLSGKELYSTIAKARFTIFPSECYENCPFTVMESQIYGTPVIGSRLGGTPELLEENVTGELFECGNATELKEKILKLWENKELQKQYSMACKNVKFDNLQTYVEKILEIYERERGLKF